MVALAARPIKGSAASAANSVLSVERAVEALRDGNGPRKALENHNAGIQNFESVVRSVLTFLHGESGRWKEAAPSVLAAISRLEEEEEEGIVEEHPPAPEEPPPAVPEKDPGQEWIERGEKKYRQLLERLERTKAQGVHAEYTAAQLVELGRGIGRPAHVFIIVDTDDIEAVRSVLMIDTVPKSNHDFSYGIRLYSDATPDAPASVSRS